jgi:quinoprotein glucose dehydrogenase
VRALGVTTKSGYLYNHNRETGVPIFGVEERTVPASDVPGERASATQPIPLKPAPIARNSFQMSDLVSAGDTTPEHAAACQELVKSLGGVQNNGPFTPWRLRADATTTGGATLVFPGGLGGANWGGTAFDPATRYLLVATQDVGALGWMQAARAGAAAPYEKATGGRGTFDVRMGDTAWPCQKPPWGRLIAVNTATGDVAWQIPLGITEDLPAAKQRTGRPLLAGPIVTAGGVVFIASTDDNRVRALDAKTGRELWVERLARRGNADPMTFTGRSGQQLVAVSATDTLVVFGLP